MTGADTAQFAAVVMCLVLVSSALAVRRLPLGPTIKMALTWVALFGVAYVLFLYRNEARAVWSRLTGDIAGASSSRDAAGKSVRIVRRADGHFWIDARVNGVATRFLIDTGATTTMLNEAAASAAHVGPSPGSALPVETANGFIQARPARIAKLSIGSIERSNERVLIAPSGGLNVLGMSFLDGLGRWNVEGDTLTLIS